MSLPKYYSLKKAAEIYKISKKRLNFWLERGILDGIQDQTGEILVSQQSIEENLTKAEIINHRYPDLVGVPITLKDASEKYDVPKRTIFNWARYYNYITVLSKNYRIKLDEADVAYCAAIYHQRQDSGLGTSGAPLLHDDGRPYALKRPDVAAYRRQRREAEPIN